MPRPSAFISPSLLPPRKRHALAMARTATPALPLLRTPASPAAAVRPSSVMDQPQPPAKVNASATDASATDASASASASLHAPFDAASAVRPELRAMAPYTPILPYDLLAAKLGRAVADIVKLDANESPFGAAPAARTALASEPFLHIYPDPACTTLRAALADYTGVPPEHLLVGTGADEIIDLLFRLFITPNNADAIVDCPPTFGMYKFDANVNDAEIINVNRRSDFSLDMDAIESVFKHRSHNPPKIIFIAAPNNPDGSLLSDAHFNRLLALPTLVVIDEAYFEFAAETRIALVPTTPNLVVLRTFSKWAGLAGMRVGYGAFPLALVNHLMKIKQPYNVSVAAQVAATASLGAKDDLLANCAQLIAQRARFYQCIARYDWLQPYPSKANFVLCRVKGGRSAFDVKKALEKNGILIRYYTSPGLDDCIRVSMGTSDDMDRLYSVLDTL